MLDTVLLKRVWRSEYASDEMHYAPSSLRGRGVALLDIGVHAVRGSYDVVSSALIETAQAVYRAARAVGCPATRSVEWALCKWHCVSLLKKPLDSFLTHALMIGWNACGLVIPEWGRVMRVGYRCLEDPSSAILEGSQEVLMNMFPAEEQDRMKKLRSAMERGEPVSDELLSGMPPYFQNLVRTVERAVQDEKENWSNAPHLSANVPAVLTTQPLLGECDAEEATRTCREGNVDDLLDDALSEFQKMEEATNLRTKPQLGAALSALPEQQMQSHRNKPSSVSLKEAGAQFVEEVNSDLKTRSDEEVHHYCVGQGLISIGLLEEPRASNAKEVVDTWIKIGQQQPALVRSRVLDQVQISYVMRSKSQLEVIACKIGEVLVLSGRVEGPTVPMNVNDWIARITEIGHRCSADDKEYLTRSLFYRTDEDQMDYEIGLLLISVQRDPLLEKGVELGEWVNRVTVKGKEARLNARLHGLVWGPDVQKTSERT